MAKIDTSITTFDLEESGAEVESILQSVGGKASNSSVAALSETVEALSDTVDQKLNASEFTEHMESAIIGHPNGSVTSEKIADEAITTEKIADESVNADKIADEAVGKTKLDTEVTASLDKADGAIQTVEAGTTNGTIKVDGEEIAVAGLASAAYAETTDFDAAGTAETKVGELANGAVAANASAIVELQTSIAEGIADDIKEMAFEEVKQALLAQIGGNTVFYEDSNIEVEDIN